MVTVAPIAQLVKGRLLDAGGLRFESQAGRVTGKSIPSLWRETHPAIKGLRPPEHHVGQFHPDQKDSSESKHTNRTPSALEKRTWDPRGHLTDPARQRSRRERVT